MINNVTLIGRLTKDVELKYTGSGLAVAQFTLAVARDFSSKNGERETDFINCVAWQKSAETLANYVKKGSLIGVVGRIQTRNYENNQGQKVYITEVVVERFNFLEKKDGNQQQGNQQFGNQQRNNQQFGNQQSFGGNQQYNNQQNFNNQQSFGNQNPFGGSVEIGSDDLPF